MEPAAGELAWSPHAHPNLKIGMTFQRSAFESLGEIDLDQLATGSSFPSAASIDLSTEVTRINVRYAPSRRIHIGTSVPFVRTWVKGESFRTAFVRDASGQFIRTTLNNTVDESSAGLGDIALRGRINLIATRTNDTGVQVDVILPTGSRDELLGTGTRQMQVSFVNSSALGPLSVHVNAGYLFGGNGVPTTFPAGVDPDTLITPSREINYAAGLEASVAPRLAINGDIAVRHLLNGARFFFRPFPNGGGVYAFEPDTVSSMVALVGATIRASNAWFLTGRAFLPLKADGLKAKPSVVFGMETGF